MGSERPDVTVVVAGFVVGFVVFRITYLYTVWYNSFRIFSVMAQPSWNSQALYLAVITAEAKATGL